MDTKLLERRLAAIEAMLGAVSTPQAPVVDESLAKRLEMLEARLERVRPANTTEVLKAAEQAIGEVAGHMATELKTTRLESQERINQVNERLTNNVGRVVESADQLKSLARAEADRSRDLLATTASNFAWGE